MESKHVHETECHTVGSVCHVPCISGRAVIAGALVGVGLTFLLSLFGMAIGLSAVTTTKEGLTTLAIGGLLGILISTVVSMFVAGWVAGYVGRFCSTQCCSGVLHGFVTWCLILLLSAVFATHIGDFMSSSYESFSQPSSTVVNVTTDKTAPAVTTQETKAETNVQAPAQVNVNVEKAANVLGATLWLVFGLFAVGALSSCLGGYVGIRSRDDCRVCDTTVVHK